MGTLASGVGAGPCTTCALCAGSKAAPWHGQSNNWLPGSYCTVQPAWVQIASNATKLPLFKWTTTPGSPLLGTVNIAALLAGTWLTSAIVAPVALEVPAVALPELPAGAVLAGNGALVVSPLRKSEIK